MQLFADPKEKTIMKPLIEALHLLRRQAELEKAMRRRGGIPVIEEQELFQLRETLAGLPGPVKAVLDTSNRLGRAIDDLSIDDLGT
jgi:hypothetical protein